MRSRILGLIPETTMAGISDVSGVFFKTNNVWRPPGPGIRAAGTTFFLQKPVDRQRLTNLFKAARGTMFENRRHFVRVPLQTAVTCRVEDQTFQGTSSNISQGGILFEMGRSLPVGANVRLSFRLPGRDLRIDTNGVVARVDDRQRIGVQFTRIGARELDLIRDLIGSDDADTPQTSYKPT